MRTPKKAKNLISAEGANSNKYGRMNNSNAGTVLWASQGLVYISNGDKKNK